MCSAVRYLREHGAKTVAVIGASMGGGASANAVVQAKPGEIDRLILLAPVPIEHPELLAVPKLYATAEGDSLTPRVREQYQKAPQPKELLILERLGPRPVPVHHRSGPPPDARNPALPVRSIGGQIASIHNIPQIELPDLFFQIRIVVRPKIQLVVQHQ